MKRTLMTVFVCAVLSIGYGQTSNNTCPGVNADFTSVAELAAGGIRFTNASQLVPNENYTMSWEFGNGEFSNEDDPFCMYDEGTYQVKLTVLGPNGCQTSVTKEVTFSYNGQ